jgi:hypothetical protein
MVPVPEVSKPVWLVLLGLCAVVFVIGVIWKIVS